MTSSIFKSNDPAAPAQNATLPADAGGNPLPSNLGEVVAKRRGVKAGVKRGPYKRIQPGEGGNDGPVNTASDEILTKDALKPIIALPFNMATIKTGFEGFLLTELEEENLARSGSVAFNAWVKIDPRYVALLSFSLGILSITAGKMLMYRSALRQRAEAEAARAAAKVE